MILDFAFGGIMKTLMMTLVALLTMTVYASEHSLETIQEDGNTYHLVGGFKNYKKDHKISYYCNKVYNSLSEDGYGTLFCLSESDMIVTLSEEGRETEYEILTRGNSGDFLQKSGQLPESQIKPKYLNMYLTDSTFNSGHGGASSILGFLIAGVVCVSIDLISIPFQLPFILTKKNRKAIASSKLQNVGDKKFYKVTNKTFNFIKGQIKRIDEMTVGN